MRPEYRVFDLSSSKLFLLAVIALLVVGPKDLPHLLRTVGRYVGMVRRQAAEFRAQFDDAMRQSELSELKQQVEDFGREAENAVREAETAVQKEADALKEDANRTASEIEAAMKFEADATVTGPSAEPVPALPAPDAATAAAIEAASPPADLEPRGEPPTASPTSAPAPAAEKVGA
jgi:sec-independent protein translocase protein TatB